MNPRLVILQSKHDCNEYRKNFLNRKDLIFPIGPESIYFCQKEDLKFYHIDDFISEEKNNDERKKSVFIVNKLIEKLNDYSIKISKNKLEIGNYFSFQIKIIVEQILFNIFISKEIKEFFPDHNLLIFKNKKIKNFRVIRPDPLGLLPNVIINSQQFDSSRLKVVKIRQYFIPQSFKEKILSILPEYIAYLLRNLRDKRRLKNSLALNTNKYRLALIGGGYDWFKFIRLPSAKNKFNIDLVNLFNKKTYNQDKKELKIILNILNNNIFKNNVVAYDFEDLAKYISSSFKLFQKKSNKYIRKFKRYDAVISSILCFPEENFLAHMSTKADLPLIIWQHGEKGQSHDDTSYFTEILYSSHYLSYGKEVANQYKEWIGKNNFKMAFKVGSLQKNITWKGKDSKSILYATGKWQLTSNGFNDFIDPDKRLYKAHQDILYYLNNLENWKVTFKSNNTEYLNAVPYQDDFRNINFNFKSSFSDLLKNTGIVILDTPATTLIESISTEVPIFVLSGRVNYYKNFINDAKKRVVWCSTTDDLIVKLSKFINSSIYEGDVLNQTYKENYFSNYTQSQTATTVIKKLENIINKYE